MDTNTPTTIQSTNTAPSPAQPQALAAELAQINFDVPPEAEEIALQALATALSPRFVIVEKSLAVKFPNGQVIKISLDVPFEKFEEIVAGNGSDAEQLDQILDFLGQGNEKAVLRGQGTVAVMATASKYFTTWQKVVGASLGESSGSGLSA